MKITVLSTGGTIASTFDGKTIDVKKSTNSLVLEKYLEHNKCDIDFTEKSPVSILSESISKTDFEKIALSVYNEKDISDGIIITCGSDTLSYISSFIGLLFCDTDIPIILVASNKILDDENSNGYENFCCAVNLIENNIKGVFVPYKNSDGVMYVHRGTQLLQADFNDDFYSLCKPYGFFDNRLTVLDDFAQKIPSGIFSKEEPPKLDNSVLMIEPYPLQNYDIFDIIAPKAVLHTLYHSATADDKSAVDFIKKCNDNGKQFFLCSAKAGQKFYSSTAALIKAGAVMLYDISPSCAYIKLLLAVNQNKISVEEFMKS
ncbi:MAG: asparaginase [Oscillospiraceae bacterium]|nr:asparaginase [Candidatus Ruminococcus equi]